MITARIVAKVAGIPVVLIAGFWTFVRVVESSNPTGFKLVALVPITAVLLLVALRIYQGTEQGSTDLEAKRADGSSYAVYNIPFSAIAILERVLTAWGRRPRYPLPRPRGLVRGSAGSAASVVPFDAIGEAEAEAVVNEITADAEGIAPPPA